VLGFTPTLGQSGVVTPIQFKDTFVEHFNPHQFGVATLGGCEIMVHGVKIMLDLHLKWVVLWVDVRNTFNLVFEK
jgi:hypothetical protein